MLSLFSFQRMVCPFQVVANRISCKHSKLTLFLLRVTLTSIARCQIIILPTLLESGASYKNQIPSFVHYDSVESSAHLYWTPSCQRMIITSRVTTKSRSTLLTPIRFSSCRKDHCYLEISLKSWYNSTIKSVSLLVGQHLFEGVDRAQSLGSPIFLGNDRHCI